MFLEKRELRNYLLATVTAPEFEECVVWVKSQLTTKGMTQEQMHGAEMFLAELLSFPLDEQPNPQWPTPGMNHNLDNPEKKIPTRKKK